jgi:hypothetical protein
MALVLRPSLGATFAALLIFCFALSAIPAGHW